MNKVYLVGNAHIDPVWLWRKTEGLSEIMATFRSALDRLNEFPGFIFTSACASYYKWVEDNDERMFAEIRKRVAEGRWAIAGGFWVQPDCNIPGGEAFARHALYSQRYFMRSFGVAARTGYNVDSFGHNGMLPQLLVKSGMNSYVFSRPNHIEKPDHPGDLFVWRSPDGSAVTAAHLRNGYGAIDVGEIIPHLSEESERLDIPLFCFYGIGNHGGGPSIAMLKELETICGDEKNDGVAFASVDQLFDDLRDASCAKSPRVYTGDLQHHASGCYSANSAVKTANRRAENELTAAEKFNSLAHRLTGARLETEKLREAWQLLLFNQFHDVLAGCSIKDAYADALNEIGAARSLAADVMRLAAQRISWRVCTTRLPDSAEAQNSDRSPNGDSTQNSDRSPNGDSTQNSDRSPNGDNTQNNDRSPNGNLSQKNGWLLWEREGEGAPVVVFNPHSFHVTTEVQVNAKLSGVADPDGRPIKFQNVRGPQTNGSDTQNAMFIANIPAFGYATYYLYKDARLDAEGLLDGCGAPNVGEMSDGCVAPRAGGTPDGCGAPRAVEPPDGCGASNVGKASDGCGAPHTGGPPVAGMSPDGSFFMENGLLKVEFNAQDGSISALYDKEGRRGLIAGPAARAIVIDDADADTWAHAKFVFDRQIGAFGDAQIIIYENGPLRCAVGVRTRYKNSELRQTFYLTSGSRELRAECKLKLDEKHVMIKLAFPFAADKTCITYSMPYGFIEKECDGLEEPSQAWACISDADTGEGLALINDSKYSFCAASGEMRMAVARSAIYADHFGERDDRVEYLDQGELCFKYALRPAGRTDFADVVRGAELLNQPPHIVLETHHDGMLGNVRSGIDISADNVICKTLKRAEDGEGYIARFYETAGRTAVARVELTLLGATAELEFKPQEIRTLRIEPNGTWREVMLTEYDY